MTLFYEFCCSLFPLSAWESLRLCKLAEHHSIPVLYPLLIMLSLFCPTLIQTTCLSWKSDIFNQWLCLQHSSHCVWLEPGVVQWSVTSVWMGNVEPISWKDRSWNCLLGHMIKSHSLLSANQTSCRLVGQTLNRFFFCLHCGHFASLTCELLQKIAEFLLLADCFKILSNTCQNEVFVILYYDKFFEVLFRAFIL